MEPQLPSFPEQALKQVRGRFFFRYLQVAQRAATSSVPFRLLSFWPLQKNQPKKVFLVDNFFLFWHSIVLLDLGTSGGEETAPSRRAGETPMELQFMGNEALGEASKKTYTKKNYLGKSVRLMDCWTWITPPAPLGASQHVERSR